MRAIWRRLAAGLALAVAGCLPGPAAVPTDEAPGPAAPPAPESREPPIRVGLAVDVASATVAGEGDLVVTAPDGSRLARIPAGQEWRAVPSGTGVVLAGSPAAFAPMEVVEVVPADGDGQVRVNGRPYRGSLSILRTAKGLTVVNRLGLEAYLRGVVSAELGRRGPDETEAVRAQAVVSRTYAVRNMGRWRAQGFDLYASVSDQVYGGVAAESPEGTAAVEATRGLVVMYGDAPIDAFFFSTCGGRTELGTEIFRAAARPYLRSVSDEDEAGRAYCRISPRYRWREEWNGEVLRSVLRKTLASVARVPADRVTEVRDVRVTHRSGSGRAVRLAVTVRGGQVVEVDAPVIRQVLRTPSGDPLRSNAFTLQVTHAGRTVSRLVADGGGAGHGVGFCQWGAVGRARAGQDYVRIVQAYYPGTELARLY